MKSDIGEIIEILLRIFKFHENRTVVTGTLHEDQYTFFIISRPFLLRMRNVTDKIVEKIKICILSIFFKSCLFLDNLEKYGRIKQATDDNMTHVHCMLNT